MNTHIIADNEQGGDDGKARDFHLSKKPSFPRGDNPRDKSQHKQVDEDGVSSEQSTHSSMQRKLSHALQVFDKVITKQIPEDEQDE